MTRLSFRLSQGQIDTLCHPCDSQDPPQTTQSLLARPKTAPGFQILRSDPKPEQIDKLWNVPSREGESRIKTLCLDILCARKRERVENALLPDRGHLETFSARTHLVAGIVFLVYTVARFVTLGFDTTRGTLVVLAGLSATVCFFCSTFYHTTSPDCDISKWSRQLDFISIYLSLGAGWLADMAITTREFENVPIAAILDVPFALLMVVIFFGCRRLILWDETPLQEFQCNIGLGLFRQWNADGDHTALRQTTSFIISSFTFSLIPVIVQNLGLATPVVISLQVVAFFVIVSGMIWDNIVVYPDYSLARGRAMFCVIPSCGCILSAHGWWHVAAFLGSVLTVVAREVALYTV